MTDRRDFEEIGHSGGKMTVDVDRTDRGLRYAIRYSSSNPVPVTMVMLYALPQGIPIERVDIAGIGGRGRPPTIPGSYQVIMASDREGWFGRTCPKCRQYWRSSDFAQTSSGFCAYCGLTPSGSLTLTDRQRSYVEAVCDLISQALERGPGSYTWDLDDLPVDTVGGDGRLFYLADERQQTHSVCEACGTGQDVMGGPSYCCSCGSRNDYELLSAGLETARDRARADALGHALRDAVSAWDGFSDALIEQLVKRVPLTNARRSYWADNRPRHKLNDTVCRLDKHFGFQLRRTVGDAALATAHRMVARRHLHEHRQGRVDQQYLDETGDDLRIGQILKEDKDEVFGFIGILQKLGKSMTGSFHELFPPDQAAIEVGRKYLHASRNSVRGKPPASDLA
jgi:hypothetical protein